MANLCISNLVYGNVYTHIFLNYHLKSVLENITEETNFNNSVYFIFTDGGNLDQIKAHENFIKLSTFIPMSFFVIQGGLNYQGRYHFQKVQMQHTVKYALEHHLLMHISCADMFYGPRFFTNALHYFSLGHEAIIVQPARVAFESAAPLLSGAALSADALFEVAFNNLHPLWTSANWDNPYFTNIPYHLIWSDEKSICFRGFSLSPLIVVPQEWMLSASGCADMSFLPNLKNQYFSEDWTEMPCIELQQLMSFYPPFSRKCANTGTLAQWAKKSIPPDNYANLNRYMMFKKSTDPINHELITQSQIVVDSILVELGK